MSRLDCCPMCLTEVPGWATACPKCRYHPDSHSNSYYNRAQDDVAMIYRMSYSVNCAACHPPVAPKAAGEPLGWRSWLPHWLGGSSGGEAQPPQSAA